MALFCHFIQQGWNRKMGDVNNLLLTMDMSESQDCKQFQDATRNNEGIQEGHLRYGGK